MVVALVLAGWSISPARADAPVRNLLPNGSFELDAPCGWSSATNPGGCGTADIDTSPTSGSLGMETYPDQTGSATMKTCFPVVAGAPYAYGGQSRVTGASAGTTSLVCTAYDASGAGIGALGAATASSTTLWGTMTSHSGVLPPDAACVSCTAWVQVSFMQFNGFGEFDNLYFNSASPDPVYADDFEGAQ